MTAQVEAQVPNIPNFGEALKTKTPNQEALERLARNKASIVGLVIIVFFMLVAIFARVLAPHDPLEITSGQKYLPPAWVKETAGGKASNPAYLLGTDSLGRDVLSRVIFGARVSMVVGFVPTFIIVVIGTIIGMTAGYLGGTWDNILMRLTDVIYAFPDLLFFIIVMVSLRDTWLGQFMNGMFLLFASLAIVNWVGIARLVRGQVLSLKQKEFIEAARAIGVKTPRIMTHHLLPNTLGVIIVYIAFRIPGMIITEAILGYLGLGLRPPANSQAFFVTSWGGLLLEGQTAINAQPWILLAPAICIALVVLAFTFLGDGLRDALDPRMRGSQ
ncbi:MAG: ABC transporter permease [Anaerolineales bacterium]|nr:ABC transporter permease [Anaerolineales bacterium]MDW8277305.1 ABC transporter permease [Anaerolineales bacterium]